MTFEYKTKTLVLWGSGEGVSRPIILVKRVPNQVYLFSECISDAIFLCLYPFTRFTRLRVISNSCFRREKCQAVCTKIHGEGTSRPNILQSKMLGLLTCAKTQLAITRPCFKTNCQQALAHGEQVIGDFKREKSYLRTYTDRPRATFQNSFI